MLAVVLTDQLLPGVITASLRRRLVSWGLGWPMVTLFVDLRRQGELAARTLVEMLKNKETRTENRYLMPKLHVLQR